MAEVIVFGIDSHAASLAICGVDEAGRRVCAAEFVNNATDHAALLAWTREHAPQARRFGIEGSGGYAHALSQYLLASGERGRRGARLADAPRAALPARRGQERRQRRARDRARHVARGDAAAASPGGAARDLKLLYDYRRQLT